MPDLAIVVPWRSGDPYREASQAFVTVWLRHVFPDASLELADDGGTPFARGASIDQAVQACDAPLILVCDADILVPAAQLHTAVALAATEPGQVIPFSSYRYLTGPASELLRAGPVADDGWAELPVDFAYAVAVGAACAFARETHEQAGGHPGFRGWGMEDVAFFMACETLVAPMRRVDGNCYHLWHPTAAGSDYRDQAAVEANTRLLDRYGAAEGNREAMASLVAELRALTASNGGV